MKWLLKTFFGAQIEQMIRERWLHVPESELDTVAARVSVSPGVWRAMETIAQERAVVEWRKW